MAHSIGEAECLTERPHIKLFPDMVFNERGKGNPQTKTQDPRVIAPGLWEGTQLGGCAPSDLSVPPLIESQQIQRPRNLLMQPLEISLSGQMGRAGRGGPEGQMENTQLRGTS